MSFSGDLWGFSGALWAVSATPQGGGGGDAPPAAAAAAAAATAPVLLVRTRPHHTTGRGRGCHTNLLIGSTMQPQEEIYKIIFNFEKNINFHI